MLAEGDGDLAGGGGVGVGIFVPFKVIWGAHVGGVACFFFTVARSISALRSLAQALHSRLHISIDGGGQMLHFRLEPMQRAHDKTEGLISSELVSHIHYSTMKTYLDVLRSL